MSQALLLQIDSLSAEARHLGFCNLYRRARRYPGAQMSVSFQPGMQYAGFELTHYGGTTISNLDPDPENPNFLLEGITDAIFIAYIGVESTCDADVNGLNYTVDLTCRQKAEPARL